MEEALKIEVGKEEVEDWEHDKTNSEERNLEAVYFCTVRPILELSLVSLAK